MLTKTEEYATLSKFEYIDSKRLALYDLNERLRYWSIWLSLAALCAGALTAESFLTSMMMIFTSMLGVYLVTSPYVNNYLKRYEVVSKQQEMAILKILDGNDVLRKYAHDWLYIKDAKMYQLEYFVIINWNAQIKQERKELEKAESTKNA